MLSFEFCVHIRAEDAKWITFGKNQRNDKEVEHVQVGLGMSVHWFMTINGCHCPIVA